MGGRQRKNGTEKKSKNRFKFKSFNERLEELEIDVFRNLDAIKLEPAHGSSFFHESLVQWRESNAAAEFVAAYEEILPLVQTLPQLLLHKTTVVHRLISFLQPSAQLSLEPILSLIAVLSRDLGQEFVTFVPEIFGNFVKLLELGGDRNPEIMEQVFTSISYIFKYMSKFFSKNVAFTLEVTRKLRFYPQHYVRLFANEAVSFVLRNAPVKEVIKGVRRSLIEVERDPSDGKVAGCSALLLFALKGPSNGLHSRAEQFLKLLLDESIIGGIHKERGDGKPVLDVLKQTFVGLCEDVDQDKLHTLWSCLLEEMTSLLDVFEAGLEVSSKQEVRLVHLLSLLNSMIECKKGRSINEQKSLVELVPRFLTMMQKLENGPLLSEIFTLLLNALKSRILQGNALFLSQWAPAFDCTSSVSLLPFLEELLELDATLVLPFATLVLRALERFVESHRLEVLPMFLHVLEVSAPNRLHSERMTRILVDIVQESLNGFKLRAQIELQPALVWTALRCSAYLESQDLSSLCLEYARAIDDFLSSKAEDAEVLHPLLGTALASHLQLLRYRGSSVDDCLPVYLKLGLKHGSSFHVLEAVADCMRQFTDEHGHAVEHPTELNRTAFVEDAKILEKNLANPCKRIRVATLRILSLYEPLKNEPTTKRLKGSDGQPHDTDNQVLNDVLLIDASPFDLEHSRQSCSMLSQISTKVQTKRLSVEYISLLFHATIGILHNRFTPLWDPAIGCLVAIMEGYGNEVWEDMLDILAEVQDRCLSETTTREEDMTHSTGIMDLWNSFIHTPDVSTPAITIVTLLLRTVEKVPSFINSRPQQLVSLFLKWVGNGQRLAGKDWKLVLKNWLAVLEHLRNMRGLAEGPVLKQLLGDRFLLSSDPDIQKKAFSCLLSWKDAYLTSYKEHLSNLISFESFRDELVSWHIDEHVAEEHRNGLIPVIFKILYPKLAKRGKLGKLSVSTRRSAILSFISQVDVKELAAFFLLMLHPLEAGISCEGTEVTSGGKPRWEAALMEGSTDRFIEWVGANEVTQIPHKRKVGFLQLVREVLNVFNGERIEPYLHALLAFILRFLEFRDDSQKKDASKDIKTLPLKIIGLMLSKFEHININPRYWDVFIRVTEQSIARLREQNVHGENPSAIFTCFLAMSSRTELAPLLEKAVPNILSILLVKGPSPAVHSAVLQFVENVLESMKDVLMPHLDILLNGLSQQIACKPSARSSKQLVKRHLHILSEVSQFIESPHLAENFLDSLLPFLKKKGRIDSEIYTSVLTIIKGMSAALDIASISKCLDVLGSVLECIPSVEVRAVACEILQNFSQFDTSLQPVAQVIEDLNSMSTTTVGESDYDRRQAAYGRLTPSFFSNAYPKQVVLVLCQIAHDIDFGDLRYNASSCLLALVRGGEYEEGVGSAIEEFVVQHVKAALKSANDAARREWLIVFRELLSNSKTSKLSEYLPLSSSDVDVDFFSNIIHVQVYRRIKAMARFRSTCTKAHFSQDALKKIFIPLFMHCLFEPRGSKDGNLIDSALEAVVCAAARFQWTAYCSFLMKCFHLLTTKTEHQKVLLRLICLGLDKADDLVSEGNEGNIPANVLERLKQRVLPQLSKLALKSDGSVNVPVTVAMTKVLKLMPEEVRERELPQVLQKITNVLKSRSQDVRDGARTAIVGMSEVLGPPYLQFVVRMLQASLKRGYEKHVLGYTINAILIRMVPKLKVGEIDYCLEELVPIFETEIFGEVSEEKEVEALAAKMKERKQARSFDSLRLVAQVMTFGPYVHDVLKPVSQKEKMISSRVQEKAQLVLMNVAVGIHANPSATREEVLAFTRDLLGEFLQQECAGAARMQEDGASPTQNLHLLAEFALQLVYNCLKSSELSAKDGRVISELDPLCSLLQRCLSVKHQAVITASLRCLSLLLKMPLPAIECVGGDILTSVFSIAEYSSLESPLTHSCFKLLIVIIRHCRGVSLSETQVHALLHLPVFIDLEQQGIQALNLLKAIVERKLVVQELYDMMNRVQQLMITSQAPAIRQRCSEILLQFLLDYPLGPKRLQHHLDFLLKNLGYEHISGREAALEMLHTVIVKFPSQVLQEQVQSLFLTLITRLANDKSDHVRMLVETVLKVLMGRVDSQDLHRMMEFVLSWLSGQTRALWAPALQVTGLLVHVFDVRFERHLAEFLPPVLAVLKQAESSSKETYYSLTTIEKMLQHFPDPCLQDLEGTWDVISKLLLHGQSEVRKATARLFGLYLDIRIGGTNDWSWHLVLAAYLCEQLNSDTLDEELGEQLVKNLTALAPLLHQLSVRVMCNSKLEGSQQSRASAAISLLVTSRPVKLSLLDHLNYLASKEDASALALVFRRLEKIALHFHVLQTRYIFKLYTSIVSRLGGEEITPYLPSMLAPLLSTGRATTLSEDVKTYAEEVTNQIRDIVGHESFAKVHGEVVQAAKAKREKRKQAEAVSALVDPERHARKKMRLSLKKAQKKKKKKRKTHF